MGIPRLTTQIKPYAQPVTWRKRTDDSVDATKPRDNVIIDGPSFAYFIHHRCLATKSHARNALEALPTYRELAEAALAWLEELESFDLCIKHIFFDGFLPPSKTNVRHERLEKNLLQLRAFRSSYSNIAWGGSTATMRKPVGSASSQSKHLPARLSALPAAPFLVPVILDALHRSRFSSVTTTIAAEAEVACGHDREPNDIILTNDSDLIILAQVGRVMFFNDLQMGTLKDFNDVLQGEFYDRLHISSQLNCGDLLKLGFYMARDLHCGIKECAKQASQRGFPNDNVKEKYKAFRESYATTAQYSAFACLTEVKNPYPLLQDRLEHLDARVSELVQQWLSGLDTKEFPISGSTSDYIAAQPTRQMFLSFLIDDSMRASAWRASSDIRQLAYSILALYGPRYKMMEYDRRGERMLAVEVQLSRQPQSVMDSCISLLVGLPRATNEEDDGGNTIERWKLYLIIHVLRKLSASSTAMPDRASIQHFLTAGSGSYAWPHIHLSAQVEGCLYSLRILAQVLGIYLCGNIPVQGQAGITVLRELHDILQDLPLLQGVFDRAGGGFSLGEEAMAELESTLTEVYGDTASHVIEQDDGEGFQTQKSKKRRKGKDNKADPVAKTVNGNLQNMFSLLGPG